MHKSVPAIAANITLAMRINEQIWLIMETLENMILKRKTGRLTVKGYKSILLQMTWKKKRTILLSVVGASTYQLIRNLVAPAKPTEKAFDDLVRLVQEHYQPNRSVIVIVIVIELFKQGIHSINKY